MAPASINKAAANGSELPVTLLSRGWSFRDLQTTAQIRTARLRCRDLLPKSSDAGQKEKQEKAMEYIKRNKQTEAEHVSKV